MARPVLMLVMDDRGALAGLAGSLRRRFGADYEVFAIGDPGAALAALERLGQDGSPVALLLAERSFDGMSGIELLGRAHLRYPDAKRVLLVPYGDAAANIATLQDMALGQLDHWLTVPWGAPELLLYPVVSELLSRWSRENADAASPIELVRVVASRWLPRTHELRDVLSRNNIPYGFCDADSADGRRLLTRVGRVSGDQPVLLLRDGRVLCDPSDERLIQALGIPTRPGPGRYDVGVVGAGPAGLAAATYAASEGLRTLVLERTATGGQAGTTSLIRNYLGFPQGISGGELAWRATEQAVMFGADLAVRQVAGLRTDHRDRVLALADGEEVACRTVVLATGVTYRRLAVPGLDALLGSGVFYGAAVTEAVAMRGRRVVVVGGANSAGQAAAHLARHAEQVTLVVRGGSLATGMSDYLVRELHGAGNLGVRLHTEVTAVHGTGRLEALTVRDNRTGATETLAAAALFIMIGAEPPTDWLAATVRHDARGYLLTGGDLLHDGRPPADWPLARQPLLLETSLPGVFAAGDVRHGSIKRVAAAVGEGATAVHLVHQYLAELPEPPHQPSVTVPAKS